MKNKYIQLKIISEQQYLEEITDWLNTNNTLSTTIEEDESSDEPIYEPAPNTMPVWNDIVITSLFDFNTDIELLKDNLISNFNKDNKNQIIKQYNYSTLEFDLNEILNQKNDYQPICIANKLWLYPYDKHPDFNINNKNQYYINIEPGLAFGSGEHPTTILCLEWLAENINNITNNKLNIIDYGCGSGILSLAAAKVYFNNISNIYAIDNDPQAITATKYNAKRNNIEFSISALLPEEFDKQYNNISVDIVLANILANTLIELAPIILSKLKPNGVFVLSGILEEQLDEVALSYVKIGAKITDIKINKPWVRIVGYKI